MKKKFGALLLALCMVLTMLPGVSPIVVKAEEEHVHTYKYTATLNGHQYECTECGDIGGDAHTWKFDDYGIGEVGAKDYIVPEDYLIV